MYVAIVGERCPDGAVTRLLSLPEVDEVVKLPPDRQIAEPICDHPDSLICIFEGKLYTHAKYANVAKGELRLFAKDAALSLWLLTAKETANILLTAALMPSHFPTVILL